MVAAEGVSCCAVEDQAMSISATYRAYRATPIAAVRALTVEQTIDARTETSRRQLKGRVKGVGIVVPSVCSVPLGIGRYVVTCRARPLAGSSPTVWVGLGS